MSNISSSFLVNIKSSIDGTSPSFSLEVTILYMNVSRTRLTNLPVQMSSVLTLCGVCMWVCVEYVHVWGYVGFVCVCVVCASLYYTVPHFTFFVNVKSIPG